MNYVLRIYLGDKLRDVTIEMTHVYSVGSSNKCEIGVPELKDIFFQVGMDGWRYAENRKRLEYVSPHKFEDVEIIDREKHLAITVYEIEKNPAAVFDLSARDKILIGRNDDCDICIKNNRISGHHVELSRSENGWIIRDLHSTNGTYVNFEKKTNHKLSEEDIVQISCSSLIIKNNKCLIYTSSEVTVKEADQRIVLPVLEHDEPYPYLFKQSPRLRETIPSETIELQMPPHLGGKPSISWISVILPSVLTVAVMLGICFFVTNTMTMIYFSVPMSIIGVIMAIVRYREEKKKYKATEQLRLKKYDDYLSDQIHTIEDMVGEQRRILSYDYPSVAECVKKSETLDRTLWDRKLSDSDAVSLRLGLGSIPANFLINAPKEMLTLEDDALTGRPKEIIEKYHYISGCPIIIDLLKYSSCGIIGNRENSVTIAKNLILQAVSHLSYDDLRIVIICDEAEKETWSFARWLPHIFDDAHQQRYYADSHKQVKILTSQLEDILSQRQLENQSIEYKSKKVQQPFYLIVCASEQLIGNTGIMKYLNIDGNASLGVGALFLFDNIENLPTNCHYIVNTDEAGSIVYEKDNASEKTKFTVDYLPSELYEGFARNLAPVRVLSSKRSMALPSAISFLQGYGVNKLQNLDLASKWQAGRPEKSMAVPIGVKADGTPFNFDIHEKQHGPHGLVAGMTGSGKSEMVQSWILSMAIHFPPEAVSFVLIDFKGTGLLLPFRNLPHLAGSISDLDTNISRNLIALQNELTRRKALLDKYQVSNISAYIQLYRQGKATEALSYLFVVIDEFAEFKERFRDFMQAIDQVFAIGRTLGVHMILLTQKPANVVNDQINANTRFRWCLKVANSADSRDMLKHPDAAKIINPGRAFVQVGEDEVFEEIQSYWSGAPYDPYKDISLQRSDKVSVVDLYGNRICYETEKTTGFRSDKNEIDAVVEYLDYYVQTNHISRAKQIWTNKLSECIYLNDLIQVGFDGEKWNEDVQGLRPIVGMVDDPRSQSQYPLCLNFSDDGHVVVYGAPGVGKTTLLQTTIVSLALVYTPEYVNIYVMDFGGGSLNQFRDLPHVGGVAVAGDDERIEKLSVFLTNILNERKKILADCGLVNIASYKEATGQDLPYILLIVDNFAPVLDMYPDLAAFFQMIARDGASYGIYLLITASTVNSVSYRIAQNIKSALALHMTDKADYATIVGRTNGLNPDDIPGRGLQRSDTPLEFQIALPNSGKTELERLNNMRSLIALMKNKWSGAIAKPIPIMPDKIIAADYKTSGLLIGLYYSDIEPCVLELQKKQFLVISHKNQKSDAADKLLSMVEQKYNFAKIIRWEKNTDFDEEIAALMPELQGRKDAHSKGNTLSAQDYPYILVEINGLKDSIEKIKDNTLRRLNSIVMLGEGLNIIVVVSDVPNNLAILFNGGEMFTNNLLSKAVAILIGGSARDHGIFQTNLPFETTEKQLSTTDGYYLEINVAKLVKLVEG